MGSFQGHPPRRSQTQTNTDDAGGKTIFTLTPLSFERFGDETLALRVQADSELVNATGNVIVIRRGRLVALVVVVGLTTPDIDENEAFVRKADEKLRKLTT